MWLLLISFIPLVMQYLQIKISTLFTLDSVLTQVSLLQVKFAEKYNGIDSLLRLLLQLEYIR